MGKFWKALSEQDLGLHGGPLLCETRRSGTGEEARVTTMKRAKL